MVVLNNCTCRVIAVASSLVPRLYHVQAAECDKACERG